MKNNGAIRKRVGVPVKFSSGETVRDAIIAIITKNPGMTGKEINYELSKNGEWNDDTAHRVHHYLTNMFTRKQIFRGDKRKDNVPGSGRRTMSFTYWPSMSTGDVLDHTSVFSKEIYDCIEYLVELVDRPSCQVPVNILRDKINWIHARSSRAIPITFSPMKRRSEQEIM